MESLGEIIASLLNSLGLLLNLNVVPEMLFFYAVFSDITLTLGDKVRLPVNPLVDTVLEGVKTFLKVLLY